jgi:NAD+ kinase
MPERVAIYFKDNNLKTGESIDKLVDEFVRRGIKIKIYHKLTEPGNSAEWEIVEKAREVSFDNEKPDLVLSVGGDGTFLETVMKVKDLGVPIAGVNTGRMGFLANISADEIGK